MLPKAITLSRDLADVENSVPWGRINPLLRVIGSFRPVEDLVEDEDVVEDEEAILLRRGGGENPGDGGVVGGVLLILGEVIVGEEVSFVGVERGDETGVWSADDIASRVTCRLQH